MISTFFRRLFHSCRWRAEWTFVRHLSEQVNLYRCKCGREWANNHAIGATIPFDDETRAFYASRTDCYPPCECRRCSESRVVH
jgi:hypothetical protein